MKIIYDTPKKEFEPFSIRIETEDEARIITELLAVVQSKFITDVTGKDWSESKHISDSMYILYEYLSDKGYNCSNGWRLESE